MVGVEGRDSLFLLSPEGRDCLYLLSVEGRDSQGSESLPSTNYR